MSRHPQFVAGVIGWTIALAVAVAVPALAPALFALTLVAALVCLALAEGAHRHDHARR